MNGKRYTDEFKIEVVKQITEQGHKVNDVASRLDVNPSSIYNWIKKYGSDNSDYKIQSDHQSEINRLKKELRRVTEERDILKKGRSVLCQRVPVRYAFIYEHRTDHAVTRLCSVMRVHPSGYYSWVKEPKSRRQKRDEHLMGLVKQYWIESGGVYGYRKIYTDLMELGESCGKNRVHKLMRLAGIKSQVGYRKPRYSKGNVSHIADNYLQQDFAVSEPNKVWVTDITYIRTYEGWLYLAVVIDLFSRQIIGWSMQHRMHSDIVLKALLMAVWRRKPDNNVIIHSDQGSQYTSSEWQSFLKTHNLTCSMSRRGNCYDNAVAESFFQLLKRERIKRRIYKNREEARRDIFDYIEMFYNPIRRHGNNGYLSPVEFEKNYDINKKSVY
nr:IS3 family transposase [Denitrovibrio acetiphilus]